MTRSLCRRQLAMLRMTAPDCWSAGIGGSGEWRGPPATGESPGMVTQGRQAMGQCVHGPVFEAVERDLTRAGRPPALARDCGRSTTGHPASRLHNGPVQRHARDNALAALSTNPATGVVFLARGRRRPTGSFAVMMPYAHQGDPPVVCAHRRAGSVGCTRSRASRPVRNLSGA